MQPTNVSDPAVANFLQSQIQAPQGAPAMVQGAQQQPAMLAGGAQQRPAAHELAHVNELLRLEACDVLHTQSTLSTVQDPELRQLLQQCAQQGQAHLKALMDWCNAHNVTHTGGLQ